MLDARFRRVLDPLLDRVGRVLTWLGWSANAITVVGFGIGVGAWVALGCRWYGLALGLILANRIADGLDGAVARQRGATDLGGYLDIVFDFLFYAGVPFFFAVGHPDDALPAAFLLFTFIGTGSSFLTFAILAAKRGLTTTLRGRKSIYYLGGLTEGTETIGLFVAVCLWPSGFAILAWTFGGLCCLTTLSRVVAAVETFGARPEAKDLPLSAESRKDS